MRPPAGLILLLLAVSPLWAKPKVPIRVTLKQGIGRDYVQDSLAKNGNPLSRNDIGGHGTNVMYGRIFYMNVTVLSDDAAAVAKSNGRWCVTGDTDLELHVDYQGTLDGNSLEVEMPQKNGKIKKVKFDIVDHRWRDLSDFIAP